MIERGIIMRKLGKGTLLLVSAVMAAALFTGCGKENSQGITTKKDEVYATIKKSDQSMSAEEICAWLDYGVKNYTQFQNEVMELSYCSDDMVVLSDSVGSVVYDRNKKKVIAAVDLDKIGCDHFNSEGDEENPGLETKVKVSKDEKWMIVYNKLQGKVDGKIYAYSLEDMNIKKLSKIEPTKEINKKYDLYQKIIKDNKNRIKDSSSLSGKIGDQIRAMDVSASPYLYAWKDAKENKNQSALVVDKDGLKLYTLSGKQNQPKVQSEQINLHTQATAKIDTKLPEYHYTGKDKRVKAVFEETKKTYEDNKEENIVIIPMIDVYKIIDTKNGAKVYANFWCETYYRYGSLLKDYSAGSYPGVMYLKKTNDGYKVTKAKYAQDGALLEESIYKLCKGHPIVAVKMLKDSISDRQRKQALKKYIGQNNLKIKAYKEYGWQYINL